MTYEEFLQRKQIVDAPHGFSVPVEKLNPDMFEWQAHIDRWLLKKGRAAAFEDCGLGKSLQQLEWANQVNEHTGENVLNPSKPIRNIDLCNRCRRKLEKFIAVEKSFAKKGKHQ